jgi:transcriptional regulator with XRE-family HTH domain
MLPTVDDRLLKAFGERVRELRNKRGLSQEEFAAQCRLDRTYISGIERGRRNPSLRNIKRIASELGVTMSQLFKGLK